jgi:hypothetical protein
MSSENIELNDAQIEVLASARRHWNNDQEVAVLGRKTASVLDQLDVDSDDLEEIDNPVIVDAKTVDKTDARAVIEAAATCDSPTIMEREEREALEENVDFAQEALGRILRKTRGLHSDTVENMSLEALSSEIRGDENLAIEALNQQPETQGSDSLESTVGVEEEGIEALSAEDLNTARDKWAKADRMESRTPEYSQDLRDSVAEMIPGCEDPDDVPVEKLAR